MIQPCHECDGKVSTEAKECPHCGAPVRGAPIEPELNPLEYLPDISLLENFGNEFLARFRPTSSGPGEHALPSIRATIDAALVQIKGSYSKEAINSLAVALKAAVSLVMFPDSEGTTSAFRSLSFEEKAFITDHGWIGLCWLKSFGKAKKDQQKELALLARSWDRWQDKATTEDLWSLLDELRANDPDLAQVCLEAEGDPTTDASPSDDIRTPRKWKDLTREEKETLLPWIETAKRANAQGNVQTEQAAKQMVARLAESYGLDPKQWSLEQLNKQGCMLLFIAISAISFGAGAIMLFA